MAEAEKGKSSPLKLTSRSKLFSQSENISAEDASFDPVDVSEILAANPMLPSRTEKTLKNEPSPLPVSKVSDNSPLEVKQILQENLIHHKDIPITLPQRTHRLRDFMFLNLTAALVLFPALYISAGQSGLLAAVGIVAVFAGVTAWVIWGVLDNY